MRIWNIYETIEEYKKIIKKNSLSMENIDIEKITKDYRERLGNSEYKKCVEEALTYAKEEMKIDLTVKEE